MPGVPLRLPQKPPVPDESAPPVAVLSKIHTGHGSVPPHFAPVLMQSHKKALSVSRIFPSADQPAPVPAAARLPPRGSCRCDAWVSGIFSSNGKLPGFPWPAHSFPENLYPLLQIQTDRYVKNETHFHRKNLFLQSPIPHGLVQCRDDTESMTSYPQNTECHTGKRLTVHIFHNIPHHRIQWHTRHNDNPDCASVLKSSTLQTVIPPWESPGNKSAIPSDSLRHIAVLSPGTDSAPDAAAPASVPDDSVFPVPEKLLLPTETVLLWLPAAVQLSFSGSYKTDPACRSPPADLPVHPVSPSHTYLSPHAYSDAAASSVPV